MLSRTTKLSRPTKQISMLFKQNVHVLLTFLIITIDSCLYLLLFEKTLSKTKTLITTSIHKQQIKRNYILKI